MDERDQFIPVRKSAVLKALLEHTVMQGGEARKKFDQLCRLLGAIFHYEYFEWLEKLRDDYYHFNPDISADHRLDPQSCETARAELLERWNRVLKGANYKELPLDEIEKAMRIDRIGKEPAAPRIRPYQISGGAHVRCRAAAGGGR